jgi:hypothetical protein
MACANLDWEEFKNGSFPIRLDAGTYAEAIAQAIIQKKRILDACPERFLWHIRLARVRTHRRVRARWWLRGHARTPKGFRLENFFSVTPQRFQTFY